MPALAGLSLWIRLPSVTLQCGGSLCMAPSKHLGWWQGWSCGLDLEERKQLWVAVLGLGGWPWVG